MHEEWPHSFVAQAYFACLCQLTLWKHACHHGDRSSSSSWPLRQASACSTEFSHADTYPFEFLRHQSIEQEPLANIIKHQLRPRVSTVLEELLRIRDITIEERGRRFEEYLLNAAGGGAVGGGRVCMYYRNCCHRIFFSHFFLWESVGSWCGRCGLWCWCGGRRSVCCCVFGSNTRKV